MGNDLVYWKAQGIDTGAAVYPKTFHSLLFYFVLKFEEIYVSRNIIFFMFLYLYIYQ